MSPGGICGRSLYVFEIQTTVTGSSGGARGLIGRWSEILRARKRQGPSRNFRQADGPFASSGSFGGIWVVAGLPYPDISIAVDLNPMRLQIMML